MRITVDIDHTKQVLTARPGENLYTVLAGAGLLDAACGGRGRCGKCRVCFITNAPAPKQREIELLSAAELAMGWRLACLWQVESDLCLELPEQNSAAAVSAFWGGAADFALEAAQGYGLALDIGTTTLAAALVDLRDGARLAAATCLNSQKAFGGDVISRISHAQSAPTGKAELQAAVLGDIKALLAELSAATGIQPGQIERAVAAANPTMTHLLAGINPAPLGRAPYNLACVGALRLSAPTLGLPLAETATLYCLPAVAAYLGGDIVGGLLATGLEQPGANRLFIDIGTNGEMALAWQGQLFACSTAAGPALEGMNITCGMRAAPAAVDEVRIEGQTVRYTTIGGITPRGLAGSGLLSAISALRLAGLLDDSGRLQLQYPVCERQGRRCLVIDEAADIVLTQEDIRQAQLAKGAIRSGVEALLAAAGCAPQAVEQVLVAGGFGARLREASLIESGLLPRCFTGKIRYVGNAALAGARLCLLSSAMRERAEHLVEQIAYIELAQLADYQQRFIAGLRFD